MRISDIGTIELTGMHFKAFHGCLESEKTEGNEFIVDIRIDYPALDASASDKLEEAIDYATVYELVKAEMEIPSNLLENVSYRIFKSIQDKFPAITGLEVKVSKKNPPVAGPAEWSSSICRSK